MDRTIEIMIDQLVADEEFREVFMRNPWKLLRDADEWGLPLCDSEIQALLTAAPAVWDAIAADVCSRLQVA
jgi:hypothetical protein